MSTALPDDPMEILTLELGANPGVGMRTERAWQRVRRELEQLRSQASTPVAHDGPSDFGSARAQLTMILLDAMEAAGFPGAIPNGSLEQVVDRVVNQPQMLRGLLGDGTALHEVRCPRCAATTRARMADAGPEDAS